MVIVEYIKAGHPLKIGDTREVNERKANYLVQSGLVKIVSEENNKKDTIQANKKKNTKKQEKSLKNGVKSMLGFGKKRNKQIIGANNK